MHIIKLFIFYFKIKLHNMESKYIGYLAGLLTTSSFIPQIMKSYQIMKHNFKNKTKIKSDISLPFMYVIFIGMCFWIYYGILINHDDPNTGDGNAVILWNSVSVFFVFCIIIFTHLT